MNDQDWQARAMSVALTANPPGWDSRRELRDNILTFAREYAAEALAEVERLKDDNAVCRDAIEGAYLLVEDWARDDSNGSDMDQGAARATLRRLNEAVGKAAPLLLKERLEGQRLYGLRWKELKQEIADLRAHLAAAGPVWQPIETAPIEGRVILHSSLGATIIGVWGDYRYIEKAYWTHWIPLPAPPKDKP